jgi:glutathione-regulated potassium-efflux system ancillary protein KefF
MVAPAGSHPGSGKPKRACHLRDTFSMADILILSAHPDLAQSHVHRSLTDACGRTGLARVEHRDLYALYPDYLIDVAAEQAALAPARLVVWQHPIHWYSMPPLMKLWVDEVLSFGWAYGPGGTALRGKDLWLVTSTGGPEDSYRPDRYNRYFFDAFLPPYDQTAALCGMRFLPPLVLHGAHRVDAAGLAAHVGTFVERLASYPDWPEIGQLPECVQCEVPAGERPVD